jgi:serine O-acetyltransferase
MIGTHVVLGGRAPLIGAPTIEQDATIHAGAKIVGPIVIGRGSVIGANAVVTRDIPRFSVAVGVPARVIKSNIDPGEYR